MALRYTADALIHLRESPLCAKPNALPPAEEWMGPPPENFRNSSGNKTGADRNRNNDTSLLEQTNRRPGVDRHLSRNNANPEDIILGPPRTTFNSATLSRTNKTFENDKALKDMDPRERFTFRNRNGEAESGERFREKDRDGRNNFRRRGDGDQDSEGWSTVKPRKSFGHEGAERFSGRMGDRPDRFGAERAPRTPDDRENNAERPRRTFGEFAKEPKEGEDSEKPRRNGLARNRSDQPWTRDSNEAPPQRERFDRFKSWRERGADDNAEPQHENPRERTYERRWDRDRDHRQERDPEWLDEPAEEHPQGRTEEDFLKFMANMKGKSSAKAQPAPTSMFDGANSHEKLEIEKPKMQSVRSTTAVELGQDKFFAAFASGMDGPGTPGDVVKENAAPALKPKSGSRFQTFFTSQEETRRHIESPAPAPAAPPASQVNPLLAMLGAPQPRAGSQADSSEKVAFQALLQKLQKQTSTASTPPSAGGFAEPPPMHEYVPSNAIASPGPFHPYGQERRDELLARGPPSQPQELHTPRPQQNTQFAAMRPGPEQQMLHDLIGQRHPSQNSGAGRVDQPSSRNSNHNAEFLMKLMQQGSRSGPELQRHDQPVMRMPQPSRPAQIPPTPDREPDYQRERGASQHQGGRPSGLPSFFDEVPMHHREQETRPQQPTQILQRQQGPPGLDQMHPNNWMQAGAQQMPPPGRPMIPPPGLPGNQRNGPMPGAFPPNYPIPGFPPPDAMAGPPRNMAPPPGFFTGGPPGFMPPPGMGTPGMGTPGMVGFQGPEPLGFFDGRGMPPPGGPYRRN
ncbi:Uu.00g018020.m01.CDS01 [Anthostomella pinea]|uniref:Uu.00g018020.m01.CDS01 n=1 Tax=Anthostomella pinea TaxID=933095 RepID=A0AAI8YQK6_9PEZI|nr:Uu.00g018020.m01.CDS01 [Anthostomella pinea]